MNTPVTIFAQVQDDIHNVEDMMLAQIHDQNPDLKAAVELIVKSGGKRIRPTISLLIGRMLNAPYDKSITIAAAIELLHTATLVHDDLIDGSLLRRGMPTLNSQWSPGATVLTGDFLFARAAKLSAETDSIPAMKVFADTLSTIVNGEIEQLFVKRCHPDRKSYYRRIYSKTASLFETSAWASALISNASESTMDAMRKFGYHIGMAFQIIDDILDFVGDPETIGKPVGSDFRQGLITLPAIYYIEDNPTKKEVKELSEGKCPSIDRIEHIVAEIRASDAIEKSHREARQFIDQAIGFLRTQVECTERYSLENLANFIVDREL